MVRNVMSFQSALANASIRVTNLLVQASLAVFPAMISFSRSEDLDHEREASSQ